MRCHDEGVLPAVGGMIEEEEGYEAGQNTGCMVSSIGARNRKSEIIELESSKARQDGK